MREQRGKYLERQLDCLLDALAARGVHGHKNRAYRTIRGDFIEGEPFDYEIFSRGRLYVFDAKECRGKSWNLKTNAKLSQLNNLCMLANHGADAFFLVYFWDAGKVVKFGADAVKDALCRGVKSLKADDGEVWAWESMIA